MLYKHGSAARMQCAAETQWNTYTIEQQRQIYATIREKIRQGKFVPFDAVQALMENEPKALPAPKEEPKDWNGQTLKDGVQYVTAKYNGKWGTYTMEDVIQFKMETKNDQ